MSTAAAANTPVAVDLGGDNGLQPGRDDPFVNGTDQAQPRASHRYSSFDTQLFSLNHPTSSPSQAKRALEAHLTETDKRLQEASRLGTALVQQRKDLADRLEEVKQQQGEREIGPELRQKLLEIEKEYNELGRDSARAFLAPKSRNVSAEEGTAGSAALDARVGFRLLRALPLLIKLAPCKPHEILQPSHRFSLQG